MAMPRLTKEIIEFFGASCTVEDSKYPLINQQ